MVIIIIIIIIIVVIVIYPSRMKRPGTLFFTITPLITTGAFLDEQ